MDTPSRSNVLSPARGSSTSSLYCIPEQPPPMTFTRSTLPACSPINARIFRAALSEIVIIAFSSPARDRVLRRQCAQTAHLGGDTRRDDVHFLARRETPEAEANR